MKVVQNIVPRIRSSERIKTAIEVTGDALIVLLSILLSTVFLLPLLPFPSLPVLAIWVGISVITVWISNKFLNLYRLIYRHVGIHEGIRIFLSAAILFLVQLAFSLLLIYAFGITNEIFPIHAMMASGFYLVFSFAARFAKRLWFFILQQKQKGDEAENRVMIIGAGQAGGLLIHEMQNSNYCKNVRPVCILDDNLLKVGHFVSGVPVVGTTKDVEKYVEKYGITHIYVAIPAATHKQRAVILQRCQTTRCKVLTLPGIYQLLNGDVSVSKLRHVEIADLLGRDQVEVNLQEIVGYIKGKTVLVTGTGSIGSELCRQIADASPSHLILLDIYENNVYEIEQELRRKLPELRLTALIASIRDKRKIDEVFKTYRPNIVFNAAAHKHVPLMETSPNEAVKNNVFGTYNVAKTADKYGVEIMVQISTDKAVNPTNIMGATKRICEMIIQTVARHSKTKFAAVRFGNVLGSNGSVIPLFQKQIAAGGPVTVTHKDIIRYFMTIPEAVSLVLQAGSYASHGEIFVLDMGEQVRIYDLAVNLIRLSGFEPEVDIPIVITGLRPGEKLYEERLMEEEGLEKTQNKMISIGKPLDIDEDFFYEKLAALEKAALEETDKMKELVASLVTTYRYQK